MNAVQSRRLAQEVDDTFRRAAVGGMFYFVAWLVVGGFGLATIVFGLSRSFALSLLMLGLLGVLDHISVVIRSTLLLTRTPDDMRGRVNAVNTMFIGASNQLGEFESGSTAALLGPVGSVVLGGVGTLVVAIAWMRLFPALAHRDALVGDTPRP